MIAPIQLLLAACVGQTGEAPRFLVATVVVTIIVGLVITYPITRLPVPPGLRVGVLNWALSLRFMVPVETTGL